MPLTDHSGRLAGKVGVISGAAGGIGAATARAFVREGAVVGLMDLPGRQLDALAGELGDSGMPLPCDVTIEDDVAAAWERWSSGQDRADFVYVCAGQQLHGADGLIGELSLGVWERTLAVNLTGAFLVVKHAIAMLEQAGAGSLILCGSPTGLTMSGAGYTAYSASKAGMMSLARTIAADYAQAGIRANVIVPGTTRTPLTATLFDDPERQAALLAGTPIGRLGDPGDLVGIAVFLASDESTFATGATFAVDGGLTIR